MVWPFKSGSSAKTSVDIVNNAVVDVIIQSANNCNANVEQTQTVVYSGTTVGGGTRQTMNVNMQCLQNVKVDNAMVAEIANRIQQEAAASKIALVDPISRSKAVSTTNLRNFLSTKVTTGNVQNCAFSARQTQTAIYGGVQIGVVTEQALDIYIKCLMESLNKNQVAQSIVQDVTQRATATVEQGFTIGGLSVIWWFIILIILIVTGVAIWKFWPLITGSSSPSTLGADECDGEVPMD
jgi:hypothetical protein